MHASRFQVAELGMLYRQGAGYIQGATLPLVSTNTAASRELVTVVPPWYA